MPEVKKTTIKKAVVKKTKEIKDAKAGRFFEAIGRRKTAVARVRLQGSDFSVNGKPLQNYFPSLELRQIILAPLEVAAEKLGFTAQIKGGGLHAQSEALRHGIARALTEFNADLRSKLKKAGFLTRDSRMRERKKFGLKRARRAPQWTKR